MFHSGYYRFCKTGNNTDMPFIPVCYYRLCDIGNNQEGKIVRARRPLAR
jgi:hypothetical protein